MSCLSCLPKRHIGLQGIWRPNAEVVPQGTLASAHTLCHPSITCPHIYEEGQGLELHGARFKDKSLTRGTSNLYGQEGEAR